MANPIFDYKKEFKDLYMPKTSPCIIDVPEMKFIMVDGRGNPNEEGGEYQQAIEILYALSYSIKMSKMGGKQPEGYFEYVVPPLEGLWWLEDNTHFDFTEKEKYCWISMLRQPEFVTTEVFELAVKEVNRKKPHIDTSKARLQTFTEGLCAQVMHTGPFDAEPKTIALLDAFIVAENYRNAISTQRPDGTIKRHHEIYLSDFRKVDPGKMKTILRHPIER